MAHLGNCAVHGTARAIAKASIFATASRTLAADDDRQRRGGVLLLGQRSSPGAPPGAPARWGVGREPTVAAAARVAAAFRAMQRRGDRAARPGRLRGRR